MPDVVSNAGTLSRLYRQRASAISAAVRRGTRRVLLTVDTHASKLLSGSGDANAGSYPVPIRAGFLRRAQGVRQLNDTSGLVFNRARYARAVHTTGFRAYGNKRAPFYPGRPWLEDAVKKADPLAIMHREVREAVFE